MNNKLKPLIEAARRTTMSPAQKEAQRQSFAYGNTAIENDRITREMVRIEAEKLAAGDADASSKR
jgi:hypothetical protein